MVPGETVKDIVAEIVKTADPLRVYVFGSVGRGDAVSGSDWTSGVTSDRSIRSAENGGATADLACDRSFRMPTDILLYRRRKLTGGQHHVSHNREGAQEGLLAYGDIDHA